MKFNIEELSKKAFTMTMTYGKVVYTMKSNGKELDIDFVEEKDDDDYVVFDSKKGVYKTNNIDKINDETTKFILDKDTINKLFLDDKLMANNELKKKMSKGLLDDIDDFNENQDKYFDKYRYEEIFGKYQPKEITEEVKEFNNKFNKKLREKKKTTKDKMKEEKQNG